MNKLSVLLLGVVLALTLTACNQDARTVTLDVVGITASLATFDSDLDNAASAIEHNRLIYTDEERVQLRAIRERISDLRLSVKALVDDVGGLAQVIIAVDQARHFYLEAKQIYTDAKTIVWPHIEEMSPADQQYLVRLDFNARRLDESLSKINVLPDGADVTSTVTDLLAIAGMVARATR